MHRVRGQLCGFSDQIRTVFNVGRYLDTLVPTDAGWRFAKRVCVYDSEMIPNSIIYPI